MPAPDSGDSFLTVADVARILKLNQQTLRNWIDRGELPAVRVGRRVRIRRSDFDAFVEAGRIHPTGAGSVEQDNAAGFWDGDTAPSAVELES